MLPVGSQRLEPAGGAHELPFGFAEKLLVGGVALTVKGFLVAGQAGSLLGCLIETAADACRLPVNGSDRLVDGGPYSLQPGLIGLAVAISGTESKVSVSQS